MIFMFFHSFEFIHQSFFPFECVGMLQRYVGIYLRNLFWPLIYLLSEPIIQTLRCLVRTFHTIFPLFGSISFLSNNKWTISHCPFMIASRKGVWPDWNRKFDIFIVVIQRYKNYDFPEVILLYKFTRPFKDCIER